MRKFLLPLLMSSVMLPMAADARDRSALVSAFRERGDREGSSDDGNRGSHRGQRSEQHSQRSEQSNDSRPARAERSSEQRTVRIERSRSGSFEGRRSDDNQQQVQQVEQTRQRDSYRDRRRGDGNLVDGFRAIANEEQNDGTRQRDGDRRWDGNRDGTRHWDGNRDGDRRWDGHRDSDRRWSRNWRDDHRYDWRSYRTRYSSIFRLGRYYDPYGYGYRRFTIGFNLWPSYYGSSFWLNDPWSYRLPPAYGPYRWVRYYDDALLVNIYSGQVVDVIYNFFW